MDQVRPRTRPATATAPPRPLLDRVPTQRGSHPLDAPSSAGGGRPAVVLLVLALLGGSAGVAPLGAVGRWADEGSVAVGVADAQAAADGDAATVGAQAAVEADGAARAARADVVVAAGTALTQAVAVLDASPHADPALCAQLRAAVGALSGARGGAVSARELQGLTADVAARAAQVQQAETDWLAQQRAAVPSTSSSLGGAAPGGTTVGAGVSQAARIGAGGKVCTGEGMGSTEVSGADIARQINIYRTSNGMSALSVSRSPDLAAHAVDMADAGGIWHSGHDNIVGCVSDGSAKSLVSAWAKSPPHNAQMLRGDVTAMAVGAAQRDEWLYGAVVFS